MDQQRSTHRHNGNVVLIEEAKLRHRLREIASEHIRWGRCMAYRLLVLESRTVNHKRVQWILQKEGLQRPTPRRRKQAQPATGSVQRHRVWAMDFQFDATTDCRQLKLLNVIDEYSQRELAIHVGRRCRAAEVIDLIEELLKLYPPNTHLRIDNGREFIANAVQGWCIKSGCTRPKTAYIRPGSPWVNPFEEAFHSRFRDKF